MTISTIMIIQVIATPMLDDFIVRAALAGIGLSLATGPLGAFVVWRRMAYFSDAVAHAAIFGVALSLAFSVPIFAGTLVVALLVALFASGLSGRGHAIDTTLGVISHSFLAIGLVAVSFLDDVRIDLMGFLFGDILTVTIGELGLIWLGSLAVLAALAWRWGPLLAATLNEELAAAAGINPRRERLLLTLALAIVVALSIKVVGALLIGALLIIPAAAARFFARTPETMVVLAIGIGVVASFLGVLGSVRFDTPVGPSIVVAAAVIFALASLSNRGRD